MTRFHFVVAVCVLACVSTTPRSHAQEQNWSNYVRIGAYGLQRDNAESIVRDAEKSHVFGIEVDNDIPGRYESFLDPTDKLKAIRAAAEAAHKANNKAFVYIAGTECITANAEKSPGSVLRDHPDWLQRKITGEPAVFTSGAAFWISPGDEDVWISPYAKEWRRIYMERVRQIAVTGIDGIYVDIPYWMTHFNGWEQSWASFDDATVAAFRQQTGLDARKDLKLGDFHDANFRKWIDFRIDTLTDFMREIRENARSVNATILIIPEIYPGIEGESTRVGADVYEMYPMVDAIAHEYEFGEGEHMASSRTQLDWFLYQAGMLTFRAFAKGKATWILNYSWDGDKRVDPRQSMKTLAMSHLIAGANTWDAKGHEMADSNDPATRAEIFGWIANHDKVFYLPRTPMHPVGVYFSPKSRDYDLEEFLPSYRGALLLLLQAHREFQVVTLGTLPGFRGEVLLLPGVTIVSEVEQKALDAYVAGGGKLVIAGRNMSGIPSSGKVAQFSANPAKAYYKELEKNFSAAIEHPPQDFLEAISVQGELEVIAPPTVAANFARVSGTPHAYLANFAGLCPGATAVPSPATDIHVRIPATLGDSLLFLPFLGEPRIVHGVRQGAKVEFILPAVERGAVISVAAE
jgi:hypothetical protein